MDPPLAENDAHLATHPTAERDDEDHPITSDLVPPTYNPNLSAREPPAGGPPATDIFTARSRGNTVGAVPELQQQAKATNNYYKHVSENKDISKLIGQLATCINTSKEVHSRFLISGFDASISLSRRMSTSLFVSSRSIIRCGKRIVMTSCKRFSLNNPVFRSSKVKSSTTKIWR